jgi:2'-hydroxyisoflavone reductase
MKMIVLKILILGGTGFLGPHLVEELQEHGHEVTLFNRGTQNPSLFPMVEKLQGNRDGDLQALEGRQWDAVIDTSGHLPRVVEASSKILAEATNHYTFISTIGVYENFHKLDIDEDYPLAKLKDETSEEITEKNYGALKACCEGVISRYFPGKSLIIRPGLIVGPFDPTDRFTYWPIRVIKGGEILAPGNPSQNLQFIDVRDLAKWIILMVERQTTGIYNATGPAAPFTFEQLLEECQKFSKKDVSIQWIDEDFLIKHDVKDWSEIPLWLSPERNMPGFLNINAQKAIESGLTFRPVSATISSILEWDCLRKNIERQAGLDQQKEKEILALWKQSKEDHSNQKNDKPKDCL